MNYSTLIKSITGATVRLQGRAAMAVNQALVLRNWLVGAWIFEFEQHGKDRAKYGSRLLDTLARDLAKSELRGFTAAVLRSCRLAYQIYPQIRQTLSVEFAQALKLPSIRQTLFVELDAPLEQSLSPKSGKRNSGDSVTRIPVTLSPESAALTRPGTHEAPPSIRQTPSAELPTPLSPQALLQLSWSHLVELITIDDPWKRAFF